MKRLTVLLTTFICTLLLAGCSVLKTLPDAIKIPVPVPCSIKKVEKPYMPYSEAKKETISPTDANDVFFWTKLMLAEIEERKGYETQLEAGIEACNFKAESDGTTNSKSR